MGEREENEAMCLKYIIDHVFISTFDMKSEIGSS